MKYAIVKNGELLSSPSENCREPRAGEFKAKCVYSAKSENPVLKIKTHDEPIKVMNSKVTFAAAYRDTTLEEAIAAALEIVGDKCQQVREAGFVSSITGTWTGKTTKENILRSKPVADLAKEMIAAGFGSDPIDYKLATTGEFVQLTCDQIAAIDQEVNGYGGFIQSCYSRESYLSAMVSAIDTEPQDVADLLEVELNEGWPAHGETVPE